MSLRDKFSVISSNMTSSDLAIAIEDDAKDTAAKVVPVASLFLQIMNSEGTDDLTTLISDYFNDYGANFTVCTQDGDLLSFVCDELGNLQNKWYDGEEYHLIDVVKNGLVQDGIVDVDAETMKSGQGTYSWSIYQLCSSLSAQLQSSVTIQRLANLATNPNLTTSDVNTILNDLNGKITPELDNLIKNIKMIPGAINQTSLTNMLKQVYNSFVNATATGDTIDFDDTIYSVKSFNGTVVLDLIYSGAQLLSQVLLVAGGTVAKIIGAVSLAATSVLPKLASAAGISEKCVYDENANQYELAAPIFQTTTTVVNSDLADYVNENRVVKMVTPVFNNYLWKNENENFYRSAGYLNLLYKKNLQDLSYSYFQDTRHPVILNWGSENRLSIIVLSDYVPSAPGVLTCKLADALGYDSSGENQNIGLFESSDDAYIRNRITRSLSYALYQIFQMTANWSSYLTTGIEIVSTGAAPASTHEAIVENWVNRIKNDIDNQTTVLTSDMLGCLIACTDCYVPSWTFLINYVIPYLSSKFISHSMINYYTTADNNGYGKASILATALPALNFRGSFVVTPPNYEQGSAIKAILATMAAAAAVAVAVIAVKTVVSRKLTKVMTDKYIGIQREWENLKNNYGSENYVQLRNAYLKHIRRYNLLARLTGYSTLSSVQGWEAGDSTSSLSTDGFLNSEAQQQMVNTILGTNETSETNVSLAVLLKAITGRSY